ncbi:MAG TPA: DNA polymerase III subunit alpha [Gammaproteobacteria bacterium]|nr:DNA polymerase III subunit alpha [Gammaproteobacteria bacterium]
MESKFVHLRLHTEFSLSDGMLTIDGLIDRAAEDGMMAIAITDISNLYATIKFYQAAIGQGIKPIIGADLTLVNPDKPTERSLVTLLCQTNTGYQNLVKLVSRGFLEGQGHEGPTLTWDWLKTHADGLIALSGGQHGNIGQAIAAQNKEAALTHLNQWKALFGDRFYLEITRTGKPEEAATLPSLLKLAADTQTPVVATNDVRFLDADDFDAHEARVCIQEGQTLTDPARKRNYTREQYFRSQAEMASRFHDIPSALTNTLEIAKRCNVTFVLGKNTLPHFPVPEGDTTETHIEKVAYAGLMDRLNTLFANEPEKLAEKKPDYEARLKRELDVINKMGFAGYFLIVADFTQWAKDNGIPVGPGRGSGPGSLVAYALKITDLDPLALELLFERFLNPERVSMPDFDIDFCMDGRDRVIDYVMEKHGHDNVSQIITYGTMAAKAVVRDVGRVLNLGYGFVDKIAKLIPFELGITLEKALEQEPILRERYEQEEEVKTLIDLARKLEGITRNVGKHAGGIVIAPGKLTDFVPLYCEFGESAHPVTQFDKDDVEAAGLVKFDFLGLKTLTVIDRALRLINADAAIANTPKIDIGLIPLNDAATFELLKKCKSTAVFQLESHGMRDLIKRLQPDCFEDMIALVALFRPGPLQSGMVDDFINRKHGRARVIYPHPDLEPILRPTYGVILYQEQVMQIAQVLASYTLGAADILRRAMGKKKPEEMAKQREIFTKGAVARGVKEETATSIFDLMEKFAGYGFNKSHSASYALIAYQTAWLKAHYPAQFMAAVLSSDMDKTDKVIIFLAECEAMKLTMLPPDVNESDFFFKVIDNTTLRYGLGAIKGMGEAAIESIVNVRRANGAYRDLFDFCARVDLKKINKRALEALIKSGAFDCFHQNRATLLASLPKALQQAEQSLHNQTYGQQDLLSLHVDTTPQYIACEPFTEEQQLQGEKETLGFYLTGHPLNRYLSELNHFTAGRLISIHPSTHTSACVAGMITSVRTRQTKRGDRMAIFTLDDGTATMEMICFSEPYLKFRPLIAEDQVVIVTGDVGHDDFNNSAKITVRDIQTLDQARERHARGVLISLDEKAELNPAALKSTLNPHLGGQCPVVIKLMKDGVATHVRLGKQWLVKPNSALLELLKAQFECSDVSVIYT